MARLLFVHAHPDDETLATGVTIAHHLCLGHEVEVLTCTAGDEGEVIPPELVHLDAQHEDRLGPFRLGELAAAMARLGARHTLLGAGPDGMPRWRDSGMAGTPSAAHPRAFVGADVGEAAALVVARVRELRPHVLVTYDRLGGYGHPDHIQTRRVVERALAGLVDEGPVPAAYEVLTPRSWAQQDRVWLAAHVPAEEGLHVPTEDEPFPVSVVDDDLVSHVVIDPAAVDAQAAALREHRTQVRVFDGHYALSNDVAARLSGREAFARWDPRTGQRLARAHTPWAHDLLGPGA